MQTDVEICTQNRIQTKERVDLQKAGTGLLIVTTEGKSEISISKDSVCI